MARDDNRRQPDAAAKADISLIGPVDEAMACKLRDHLAEAGDGQGSLTIDLTTLGGDPEMARRMIAELDAARERMKGRRLIFLGKSVVYSAGVTFMAGFPRENRYLEADTMLLIHCRQLCQTIQLDGPLRTSIPKIKGMLHQLETGVKLEEDNFGRLIEGSDVSMDELVEKAFYNWYVPAREAVERGLVAGYVEASG